MSTALQYIKQFNSKSESVTKHGDIDESVDTVINAMYKLIEQYQGMLAQGEIGFYNQHISDLLKAINTLKEHKEYFKNP